jgi:hypothetical protein
MLIPAPCCGVVPIRVERPEDLPEGFICSGCRHRARPKSGSVVRLREVPPGTHVRIHMDAAGRVELSNESRVRVALDPTGEVRTFTTGDGREVAFPVPGKHVDLSPDAEVEVLA